MKTFSYSSVLASLFFLAGCAGRQPAPPTESEAYAWRQAGQSTLVEMDTIGRDVRLCVLQGSYTSQTKEVFALVFNPRRLPLSYDGDWTLERWDGERWVRPETKKALAVFGEELIPIVPPEYFCFSFPLGNYVISPGRYRLTKCLYLHSDCISLSGEFLVD